MKKLHSLRFTLLAGLAVFSVVSCSDDSSSGTSLDVNAGTLAARPGSPNVAVTDANKMQVGSTIQTQALSAASKAISQGFTKVLPPELGGAVAQAVSGEINKTINGTNSGNMSVKGNYSVSDQGNMNMEIFCVFNDYSDNGSIFIAGTMDYDLKTVANPQTMDYLIKGAIRFNGAYEGQMTFNYTYNLTGSNLSFTMTGTFTSGGQTVSYTYNYPLN